MAERTKKDCMKEISRYYDSTLKNLYNKISKTTPEREKAQQYAESRLSQSLSGNSPSVGSSPVRQSTKDLQERMDKNTDFIKELAGELRNLEYCLNFLIGFSE